MHNPKPYTNRVKAALDAESTSVNLKNLNNWWYALGLRLDSLCVSHSALSSWSKPRAAVQTSS